MDAVCNDRDPVILTRNREQAAVMLSLDDYEALQVTAYLMGSPANAKRLMESMAAAELGKVAKHRIDLDK